MTPPLLQEYSTSVLYYTILYYTKCRDRDRSYMEIDGIMWYTTFWSSIYANSKMVNNISVALSVFKWAAQIFIVCLVNLGGGGGLGPVYTIIYCSTIYYGIMVLWLLAPHGAQAIIVFSHYSTLSLYSLLSTLYSTLYLFQIFSSNLLNIIGYICSIIVDI